MVDQNMPHELRREAEELSAVLPLRLTLANETKVGFINQGGALKCVVGAFAPKMTPRQAAQFVVNQRNQSLSRALISLAPIQEKLADPFGRRRIHVSPPVGPFVGILGMLTPCALKVKRIGQGPASSA
jgi:hypothetical protein